MTTIDVQEAKERFLEIMDKVNQGEEYVITDQGVNIAQLKPVDSPSKEELKEALDEIREMRKNCRLHGLKIKDMIEEGRA